LVSLKGQGRKPRWYRAALKGITPQWARNKSVIHSSQSLLLPPTVCFPTTPTPTTFLLSVTINLYPTAFKSRLHAHVTEFFRDGPLNAQYTCRGLEV
jgi:hypothetical protein